MPMFGSSSVNWDVSVFTGALVICAVFFFLLFYRLPGENVFMNPCQIVDRTTANETCVVDTFEHRRMCDLGTSAVAYPVGGRVVVLGCVPEGDRYPVLGVGA